MFACWGFRRCLIPVLACCAGDSHAAAAGEPHPGGEEHVPGQRRRGRSRWSQASEQETEGAAYVRQASASGTAGFSVSASLLARQGVFWQQAQVEPPGETTPCSLAHSSPNLRADLIHLPFTSSFLLWFWKHFHAFDRSLNHFCPCLRTEKPQQTHTLNSNQTAAKRLYYESPCRFRLSLKCFNRNCSWQAAGDLQGLDPDLIRGLLHFIVIYGETFLRVGGRKDAEIWIMEWSLVNLLTLWLSC